MVPYSLSSFVGRDTAIAEIAALVDRERLVLLTGAAGMGKTRLALELVHRRTTAAGAAIWVDLTVAPTNDAEALAVPARWSRALSEALRLDPQGHRVPGRPDQMAARSCHLLDQRKQRPISSG